MKVYELMADLDQLATEEKIERDIVVVALCNVVDGGVMLIDGDVGIIWNNKVKAFVISAGVPEDA